MGKSSEEFYLVFEDGDPLRAEVVRSVLEAAEIDCFIQNEGVQNLFALGSIGGLNPLTGTVKVYIRAEDQTRAEEQLADFQVPPKEEPRDELPPMSFPEASGSEGKGLLSSLRQWFIKQIR